LSHDSNNYFQHNDSPRELASDLTHVYHPQRSAESPQSPVDRIRFEHNYDNYHEPDLPGSDDDDFYFEPNPWQSVTPRSCVSSSSGLWARDFLPSHDQHLFQLEPSPPPSPHISAQNSRNDQSSQRAESPGDDHPENTMQFRRIYHPLINGT